MLLLPHWSRLRGLRRIVRTGVRRFGRLWRMLGVFSFVVGHYDLPVQIGQISRAWRIHEWDNPSIDITLGCQIGSRARRPIPVRRSRVSSGRPGPQAACWAVRSEPPRQLVRSECSLQEGPVIPHAFRRLDHRGTEFVVVSKPRTRRRNCGRFSRAGGTDA